MADDAQRIADCRDLYIKYGGRQHEQIEREMRANGHARFRRRIMYTRRERGRVRPGWIARFGWKLMSEPGAVATGFRSSGRRRKQRIAYSSRRLSGGGASNTVEHHDGKAEPFRTSSGKAAAAMSEPGTVVTGFRSRLTKKKTNRQKARRLRKKSFQSSRVPELQSFQDDHAPNSATLQLRNSANSPTDDFHAWLKTQPGMWNWDWRHQLYIYQYLKRVTEGKCTRLMIFMPPRHGKSELVTVRYSAWRLSQDSSLNVILGSYNQRLANRFSRKVRRVLTEDGQLRNADCRMRIEGDGTIPVTRPAIYPPRGEKRSPESTTNPQSAIRDPQSNSVFPFIRQRPANSVAEWETTMGGGLRAVGVGGGVTGFGASLIVIDDPVKSRAEAESAKIREKIWDWFNDDIYTRLEPNGAIILIQTRWHEDDLAGRLLREMEDGGEQWEVISLPALAELRIADCGLRIQNGDVSGEQTSSIVQHEETENSISSTNPQSAIRDPQSMDPRRRRPGEALCPDRYDETALAGLQRQLGTYSFSALYQQRPTPAEGMIFKREWFAKIVKQAPPDLKWTRGYDLAVSTKTTADYTASFRAGFDADGNLYIDGGFRKRIEFPEQRRYILGRIAAEQDTEHGIELALHGQGIMQDLRRQARLQGRRFRGIAVEGDKLTRALKWSSLAEEGKVILVRGGWNADFIDEACSFPGGQFDDQIDAVSIAVRMHEKQGGRLIRF